MTPSSLQRKCRIRQIQRRIVGGQVCGKVAPCLIQRGLASRRNNE